MPAGATTSRDERLSQQERWATLRQAIATLPPIHQLVLQRIDVEGCSYAEVAAALDLPIGAVKSHLFHARSKVRDQVVAAGLVAASPAAASPAPNGYTLPNAPSLNTQHKGDCCT